MSDTPNPSDGTGGKRQAARVIAEQALAAQGAGDDEEAERLFGEAQRIDPEAVIAVLEERAASPDDAATSADAEPQDDEEIAAMSRTIEPGSSASSRSGITGPGSGADGED